ncbi:MAG TPA: hypothetical protein VFJ97_00025 [Dermatophilaceae bacterium]|nr:hypothetical protein [Dermatophilaceae bacterium]
MSLTSQEMRSLQLGPLWVLSALAGTHGRFDPLALDALWDTVVATALRAPPQTREILTSITADRSSLVMAFELDGRPVASGLVHVADALDRVGPPLAEDFRLALLRIGDGIARAYGPFGRSITTEHRQLLLLLAELLQPCGSPPPAAAHSR